MSKHKKYQYKFFKKDRPLDNLLNDLGKEGWEYQETKVSSKRGIYVLCRKEYFDE